MVTLALFTVVNMMAQENATANDSLQLKTAVTLTNKGLSLIPSFTLGKAAAIFDLSLGKNRLYFEPQLRFSAEGKPWSFIFWWRYRIIRHGKFRLGTGAHPSLVFRNTTAFINGKNTAITQSHRYLAAELVPNYFVRRNTSIGMYYLYSHGIDDGAVGNTHFLTVNSNFSYARLHKDCFARFYPQFYWLWQDGKQGYYFTAALTLGKKAFPLSVQSIINKPIQTNIAAGKNFVWNASLIYSFSKKYAAH